MYQGCSCERLRASATGLAQEENMMGDRDATSKLSLET